MDEGRDSTSDEDEDDKTYAYSAPAQRTPFSEYDTQTTKGFDTEMQLMTKGNESQRGFLHTDTLRTDRSNKMIEITDLSLKEELSLQNIPSADHGNLELKSKQAARASKVNQNSSARSG